MMRGLKFTILVVAGLAAVLYTVFLVALYFGQEKMIFHPAKLPSDFEYSFDAPFEEMRIKCEDGNYLSGLLFTTENPKGLVFYLHGNAGTLDHWGGIAPDYTALGYDIFLLDYRGFGKSEGEIDGEEQFFADVSSAYSELSGRYEKIVVIGYSIGTGPSAYLASKYNPSALVLQAPYYNLIELADSRVPLVPDFLKKYRFETNVFLPKVKCPIYIFHGTDDRLIPYDNAVRLHKLVGKNSKLFPLDGVGHHGLNQDSEFLSELNVILEKAAQSK